MTSGPDIGSVQPVARRQPGGPAKGDRRRQAIVEAVERLLEERAIADVSVEDIAAAAGISRSGFYFYFESKYAALGDALTDVSEAMVVAAGDFFGGTGEPPERMVQRGLSGVADLWHEHAALMSAIVEAAHSDAGARALWDDWRGRFVDLIAERIDAERAAGRAPEGAPAWDLARTLLAMNLGVLYEDGARRAGPSTVRRSVDTLGAVWLASIWGARP